MANSYLKGLINRVIVYGEFLRMMKTNDLLEELFKSITKEFLIVH